MPMPTYPAHGLVNYDDELQLYIDYLKTFEKGGIVINPAGVVVQNFVVWRAPYTCTVTAMKGWRTGGSGATVNAGKGTPGAPTNIIRSADLSLVSVDAWTDAGGLQNTSFALGDPLIVIIASVAGSPTEVGVQLEFVRT